MDTADLLKMLIGAGVGLAMTMIGFFIKGYFQQRAEKSDKTETKTESLGTELANFKLEVVKSHSDISSNILKLENKIDMLVSSINQNQQEFAKSEGRMEQQMELVASHISTIRAMHDKIEALFRIVDPPKRASDIKPV